MNCVVVRIQTYKDHLKNSLGNWNSSSKKENQLLEYLNLRNLIGLQDKMDAENEEMLHSLHVGTKDTEGDGQSAESVLSFDIMSDELDKFVEQLQKRIEERPWFETMVGELESALFTKNKFIQDLNANCGRG